MRGGEVWSGSGGFRNFRRGPAEPEVWGTEVPQRGPGAEPRWGSGGETTEADDILKITIANVVLRDRCNELEVAILSEWIKIVSTVSVFSFFYPSSCDAHGRPGGGGAAPRKPATGDFIDDKVHTLGALNAPHPAPAAR